MRGQLPIGSVLAGYRIIALALPAPTPLGAITFLGAGIWILLAYLLLWTRRRGLSRLETDRRRIAGRVCDPDSGAVA